MEGSQICDRHFYIHFDNGNTVTYTAVQEHVFIPWVVLPVEQGIHTHTHT